MTAPRPTPEEVLALAREIHAALPGEPAMFNNAIRVTFYIQSYAGSPFSDADCINVYSADEDDWEQTEGEAVRDAIALGGLVARMGGPLTARLGSNVVYFHGGSIRGVPVVLVLWPRMAKRLAGVVPALADAKVEGEVHAHA